MQEEKCRCDENCTCGCQENLECNCNHEEEKNCDCECCSENNDCNCDDCDCCSGECQAENCECGCSDEPDDAMTCKDGVCEVKKKKEKKWGKNKNDDKLNEAYNKISELEDKLIRQNADVINYRKRKEEEVNRMLKFCNEDIIKDLLPVLDNFERALKLSEDKTDESFVKLNEGYKMVYCGLENIMQKFEVKAIDGSNKPFDPVYHNAVMMEAKEGVEPGMVLEVLQKGYLYKDKIIRPAMVKVSE